MEATTDNFKDKPLMLGDYLAIERTNLANIRTLFAYLRTSLYLLTAGIGILQIKSISRLSGLAWICIIAGILLFIFGFIHYIRIKRQLKCYVDRCMDNNVEPINKKNNV